MRPQSLLERGAVEWREWVLQAAQAVLGVLVCRRNLRTVAMEAQA